MAEGNSGFAARGDILEKLNIAKGKKEAADTVFKSGDARGALRHYHESLLYLQGLDKQALQKAMGAPVPPPPSIDAVTPSADEKPKTEADEIMEKIHSNMSQCHIKLGNWKRAIETADKAIAINPKNYKAMFRKAKAQGELGYFEKAEKILEELLVKNPDDAPSVQAELDRLRAIDKEREKKHNQKIKGFLNRDKKLLAPNEKEAAAEPEASGS